MENTKYNKLTTMEKTQLLEQIYSENNGINRTYEDKIVHFPDGSVYEMNSFEQIMDGLKYREKPYHLLLENGTIEYVEFDTSFFIDLWEFYIHSLQEEVKNKQNDENFLKDNDIQLNTIPADGIKEFSENDEMEANAFFENLKNL